MSNKTNTPAVKRGRPAGTKKLKVDPSVEVVLNVKAPKAKLSKADKQARLVKKDMVVVDFNPEVTHESLQVL